MKCIYLDSNPNIKNWIQVCFYSTNVFYLSTKYWIKYLSKVKSNLSILNTSLLSYNLTSIANSKKNLYFCTFIHIQMTPKKSNTFLGTPLHIKPKNSHGNLHIFFQPSTKPHNPSKNRSLIRAIIASHICISQSLLRKKWKLLKFWTLSLTVNTTNAIKHQ